MELGNRRIDQILREISRWEVADDAPGDDDLGDDPETGADIAPDVTGSASADPRAKIKAAES